MTRRCLGYHFARRAHKVLWVEHPFQRRETTSLDGLVALRADQVAAPVVVALAQRLAQKLVKLACHQVATVGALEAGHVPVPVQGVDVLAAHGLAAAKARGRPRRRLHRRCH